MPKNYEFIEHTADLGFRASGGSVEELFVHAAEAFFEAILALESIEEKIQRSIDVQAEALDDLMVSWLNEFLFLYDTEKLVFKGFQIIVIEGSRIRANAWGETLDLARHEIKTVIKAVTYHKLYVRKRGRVWETQVIFDI
jgi:SHS2 domain-containing protein